MIYNYTKCESVIAKIMADLDISEKNIRITDIKEWIFEAVDKIGAPMLYITKESGTEDEPILKIQDKQVPIPAGLLFLDGVAYSRSPKGPWVSVRANTSTFKRKGCDHNEHDCHQPMRYKLPTTQSEFYVNNNMKYLERMMQESLDQDVTYFVKPGWLVFNKDKGYVKLAYKTIATDERGYPLIPDLTSYQEAIYWYVAMKLNFPKYIKGTLGGKGVNSAQNVYFYMLQQWNFYRAQAYAEAMMPTASDIQSIKNDWHKLLPEWDADDTFFNSQGKRQTIYNDYYYGY